MKTVLLLIFSIYILNAQIVIVTNKKSQLHNIPKEIIQYLYLAKTNKINNIKVESLLSKDKELHSRFCNDILCKSESQYNSYWARLVFTGRKPISKRFDYKEIVNKLQDINTIAYIDKKDLRDEWKIIYENH